MADRTTGRVLRDLALAFLNATLLLVLAVIVAAVAVVSGARGLARDAAARAEALMGMPVRDVAGRIAGVSERLAELEPSLAAGPSDAAAEALRGELAALRAEVEGLRGDLAPLDDAAAAAVGTALDRLRLALARALAPEL